MLVLLVILTAAATANIKAEQRIVGGEVAIEDHFQYKVAVYYEETFVCGGVILGPRHVLTAAFCQKGEVPKHKVCIGPFNKLEGSFFQVVPVASFSSYDSSSDPNGDIAVITLAATIRPEFGHTLESISIVPAGQEPVHGEVLTALSWGLTKVGRKADFARQLHKVRLPVIKHDMCNAAFNQTYWRAGYTRTYKVTIKENFQCVGGGHNKSDFEKAYGGALVNDKQQLVGITSWGLSKPGFPDIFTSIAKPEIHAFIRHHIVRPQ